jgi:F-type H+/Na+-transporting ATPase subunit alpha
VFKPEEIGEVLRKQLEGYNPGIDVTSDGVVVQAGDGIARIWGLEDALSGELLRFPRSGTNGMVFNLEEDTIGAVLFGNSEEVKEGDRAERTGRIASVPVGHGLVGRVLDPLGNPLDDKGPIVFSETRPLEVAAPGVIDRIPVREPLETGIKAIDSMIPIGRGQRELIIGDRQTGKTSIAVDAIINQKGKGVICVYVAIGQKESSVARVVATLEEQGAMDHTVVVCATAATPAPLQYIAPYAGTSIGEFYRNRGDSALIVYDDLSKHAVSYRQLSLLLRRPPGREAYPGDVFYLHSRLLERAARLDEKNGGGSLTALPIVETQAGDVAAYIPTNVISITDGQIYLETSLFHSGIRPAINVGLSVSRVGGNAQTKAMRKVAGKLRMDLAQYADLAAFAQLGTELDPASARQLVRGERLVEMLKQGLGAPLSMARQVACIFSAVEGYLDELPKDAVFGFEKGYLEFLDSNYADLLHTIGTTCDLAPDVDAALRQSIARYLETPTAMRGRN